MTASSGSTPNYWNLSSGMNWGSSLFGNSGKNTGGNMFGWDDLAVAGVGAVGGLISGFGQQQTSANIANAHMAAQADALKQGILFQRDAAKANIGLGMFGQIYGSTTGADLEFGRQAQAKRMDLGEFMPKQMGLGREQATWETAFRNSPLFREASRNERVGRLQETIGGFRAQQEALGMGPISYRPIESFMV